MKDTCLFVKDTKNTIHFFFVLVRLCEYARKIRIKKIVFTIIYVDIFLFPMKYEDDFLYQLN